MLLLFSTETCVSFKLKMSHVMRKSVLAICEQQRCRSACASVQSDQHLYCSLLWLNNTYTCKIQKFKTLACACSSAGWFESYLVGNPEDRFSRDEAQIRTRKTIAHKGERMPKASQASHSPPLPILENQVLKVKYKGILFYEILMDCVARKRMQKTTSNYLKWFPRYCDLNFYMLSH